MGNGIPAGPSISVYRLVEVLPQYGLNYSDMAPLIVDRIEFLSPILTPREKNRGIRVDPVVINSVIYIPLYAVFVQDISRNTPLVKRLEEIAVIPGKGRVVPAKDLLNFGMMPMV